MAIPSGARNALLLLWRYALNHTLMAVIFAYELVAILLYSFSDGDIDVCIPCLWTTVFHVHCPGCGLTTATMNLMKADVAGAWEANPLVFIVLPAISYYIIRDFLKFRSQSQLAAEVA
jgi:hypothetical protein